MTDTARKLTDHEVELMKPVESVISDLMLTQMMYPPTSNAIASTLCQAAVRSVALAVMMSERKSGPDLDFRARQLDFLVAQMTEAYAAEIRRIEASGDSFNRMVDIALSIGKAAG